MKATHIHRRTLLRGLAATGLAVAIPLPRLAGMLNSNGTAYAAQAGALPQRFGLWFFGNGILFPRWNPAATGSGSSWALSEELAPLAAYKSQLSVVTGLGIKSLISDDPHVAGAAGALTGAAALLKDQVNASINRRVNTVQAAEHRSDHRSGYPECALSQHRGWAQQVQRSGHFRHALSQRFAQRPRRAQSSGIRSAERV